MPYRLSTCIHHYHQRPHSLTMLDRIFSWLNTKEPSNYKNHPQHQHQLPNQNLSSGKDTEWANTHSTTRTTPIQANSDITSFTDTGHSYGVLQGIDTRVPSRKDSCTVMVSSILRGTCSRESLKGGKRMGGGI